MLKIKIILLLFGLHLTAVAQDYCSILFDRIQLKSDFKALTRKELNDLCTLYLSDFDQPVFTYGSDNPNDWLGVGESVQRYAEDMKPEGRWININGDDKLDLVISFLAGYEYTFVAFYLQKEDGFTCVHTGIGEFFGKQQDESLVYVHPACCNDPSHDFYVIEDEKTSEKWQVVDSFSVTNAYSGAFPSREEIVNGEAYMNPDAQVNALGSSASRVATFQAGTKMRLIKEIEGDGHFLHFAEVNWEGNIVLLPRAFCWVELPE